MEILTLLFGIILISLAANRLGTLIGLPSVVNLILAGFFISIQPVKELIINDNLELVYKLGDLALIALMFLAGLESSWKILNKEKKEASIIALLAAVFSLLIGFFGTIFYGLPLIPAIIVGVCLSISAEGTTADVLIEAKKTQSKVGSAMLASGIVDDILGLAFFLLVTIFLHTANLIDDLLIASAIFAFFLGVIIEKNTEKPPHSKGLLNLLWKKIKKNGKKESKPIAIFEKILLTLIVPFFFVSIGLHFDLSSISTNPLLSLFIILLAFLGKIIGTLLSKPFNSFTYPQLYLIGWAMNSRGAIGMALALIAFRGEMLSIELYSALVLTVLTTTLIFPIIFSSTLRKNPNILET